jgi:hydrogenase expression/formation protein HypD
LDGVRRCVVQLEESRAEVENAFARAVRAEGNKPAQALVADVFRVVRRRWPGIGEIAQAAWPFLSDTATSMPRFALV